MGARVNVAIVGGGIIGVSAAYYLAAEGRSVALLEREDICALGGATHSNAGADHAQRRLPAGLAGGARQGSALDARFEQPVLHRSTGAAAPGALAVDVRPSQRP